MRYSMIPLALIGMASSAAAEFYIVGVGGEFVGGYYGYPTIINDQGISFGAKLACDSVGSAGSIPKTTNDIGQLLYEFCDVNDVSFTFSDQCKGQTMVIGGTNNRCGNPCDVDGECVSGIQFGVLYIKGDPHHTVGTCYTSGPTGWTENCVSNGSHIYSELVYCHIDEAAC